MLNVNSISSDKFPAIVKDVCVNSSSKVSSANLEFFLAPSATSVSHDPFEKDSWLKKDRSIVVPLSMSCPKRIL